MISSFLDTVRHMLGPSTLHQFSTSNRGYQSTSVTEKNYYSFLPSSRYLFLKKRSILQLIKNEKYNKLTINIQPLQCHRESRLLNSFDLRHRNGLHRFVCNNIKYVLILWIKVKILQDMKVKAQMKFFLRPSY